MSITSAAVALLASLVVLLYASIWFAPAKVLTMALHMARKQAGLTRKERTPIDGLHFAYLEGGQGEALVLLHGFGGNKDNFLPVAGKLVRHYHLIIPDITGFGESTQNGQDDFTPGQQVEKLRALLQALGVKRFHLGGNSMGGQLALLYALTYPQEVLSLWLFSPALSGQSLSVDIRKKLEQSKRNPLIPDTLAEYKQIMALGMYKPPVLPAPLLAVLARERIDNADREAKIFQEMFHCSLEEKIKNLKTPTLIVFGNQDRVIEGHTSELLQQSLPHSRLIRLAKAGHLPMYEQPTRCARDYLAFRATLS